MLDESTPEKGSHISTNLESIPATDPVSAGSATRNYPNCTVSENCRCLINAIVAWYQATKQYDEVCQQTSFTKEYAENTIRPRWLKVVETRSMVWQMVGDLVSQRQKLLR
jgi:hypothetical protein